MARTSAADLAHGLKGAKFPLSKEDLIKLARKNGVADAVLEIFRRSSRWGIWLCDRR